MSYWIYQHLGNLVPAASSKSNELLRKVQRGRRRRPAAAPVRRRRRPQHQRQPLELPPRPRPHAADRVRLARGPGARRARGARSSTTASGSGSSSEATGDVDHLLLADTLPVLLPPARTISRPGTSGVCAGAWGRRLIGSRRAHPPGARPRALGRLQRLVRAHDRRSCATSASGERGRPPATVVTLGGDVHHAYLAEVAFRREAGVESAVYQAVCSPFRNALNCARADGVRTRHAKADAAGPPGRWREAAGVAPPEIRWRLAQGPTFDNQFATLELDGRSAAAADREDRPRRLAQAADRDVAGATAGLAPRASGPYGLSLKRTIPPSTPTYAVPSGPIETGAKLLLKPRPVPASFL